MNAARRKQLKGIKESLQVAIRAFKDACENVAVDLEGVRDAEQEAFDNMPEGLQSGERGEASQETVSWIEDLISTCEDPATEIEEMLENMP